MRSLAMAGLAIASLLLVSTVLGLATVVDAPPLSDQTPMEPATGPPGLAFHAMAYDAESDRVILFGGWRGGEIVNRDTWAYDLDTNSWTNMNPATSPGSRDSHAMAYDAQSDRIILFGGSMFGFGNLGDTWAYDFNSNAWTDMSPTPSPTRRGAHKMVYDAQSDRIILFGGLTGSPGNFIQYDETWAYDFDTNAWTQLRPSTKPFGRICFAFAYDAESRHVILFGEEDIEDTWAYDFNTNAWTDMNPAPRPSVQQYQAMAYDAGSDRVILVGGAGGAETWAYDFNENLWTNMNSVTHPRGRWGHAMAYDEGSDRVVLFGGEIGSSPNSDETWAYDFNANTWTDLSPTAPSAPLSLQATAGDAQVDLTWSPSSDDGGSPITGYRVWRGTVSGDLAFLIEIGNVQTYSDTGVTNDVTHYYAVAAVNSRGVGPRSSQASATPMVPDTTTPLISITSPTDGSSLATTSVTVTGTASDDIAVEKVELSMDATTWVLATGTTSWSAALTLAEGENTIFARATDASGNAATMSIAVTVVTPTPDLLTSPLVIAVGIGAGVAAVAAVAALLILRRRGKRKGEG